MANNVVNIPLTIPVVRSVAPVFSGIPSDAKLVLDQTTAYGKTYYGSASRCIYHISALSTGIGAIDDWITNKSLAHHDSAVAAHGGKLLHLQHYKRTVTNSIITIAGLTYYNTVNYYAVVEADIGSETGTMALALNLQQGFPWGTVITLALWAVLLWFATKVLDKINTFVYGSPSGGGILGSLGGVGTVLIIAVIAYLIISSTGKKKEKQHG